MDARYTQNGWGRGHEFWKGGGRGGAEYRGELSLRCSFRGLNRRGEPFSEAVRCS
jgi:hypothetical protein